MKDENESTVEIQINVEAESGSPIQPHNGERIDRIIVSPYVEDNSIPSYAVTYSKDGNSIVGWNIEENGQQQPDVYIKIGRPYYIYEFLLYKRILQFRY